MTKNLKPEPLQLSQEEINLIRAWRTIKKEYNYNPSEAVKNVPAVLTAIAQETNLPDYDLFVNGVGNIGVLTTLNALVLFPKALPGAEMM